MFQIKACRDAVCIRWGIAYFGLSVHEIGVSAAMKVVVGSWVLVCKKTFVDGLVVWSEPRAFLIDF